MLKHMNPGDVPVVINPSTPRVKPWVIQSFLTFDSVDRTLMCEMMIHWKAVEQYFTDGAVCF